jgi:hypothetical protein
MKQQQRQKHDEEDRRVKGQVDDWSNNIVENVGQRRVEQK